VTRFSEFLEDANLLLHETALAGSRRTKHDQRFTILQRAPNIGREIRVCRPTLPRPGKWEKDWAYDLAPVVDLPMMSLGIS